MKWVSQFYGGGGRAALLPCFYRTHFDAKEPSDAPWHRGPVIFIFTSVSINNVSPFVLSRIAIFTYALWSHLSEEGQDLRL